MPQQKAGGNNASAVLELRQGEMVKGGEAFSDKCLKEFVTLDHTCSSGQQSCSSISLEDGWYPQSTAFKNQQVNLELSAITLDHNSAEYLLSRLNVRAHWLSRNATDSSDGKFHQKVYLRITKLFGTLTVDLFASRLFHQLPQYMA